MPNHDQQFTTEELQALIKRKHAISAFLDIAAKVDVSNECIHMVADEIRGHKRTRRRFSSGTIIELYVTVENVMGDYIVDWFSKNTIKAQLFASMKYKMEVDDMGFDESLDFCKGQLLQNAEGRIIVLVEEAVIEYREDVKQSFIDIDKDNFPEG